MTTVQVRFQKDVKLRKPYSYGPYNVVRGTQRGWVKGRKRKIIGETQP